jgi:hypothetical protein
MTPRRSVDGGTDEIPLPNGVAGRLFLAGKHAVAPDPEAALERIRGDTIVCLNERAELEHRYPQYVDWLAEHVEGRAIWAPTHDLGALTPERTEALVDAIVARLGAGETLLVHCGAGVGRAGTIAVAVVHRLGVPLAEAQDTVRRHRPMAGPEAGAQRELIEALEARWAR